MTYEEFDEYLDYVNPQIEIGETCYAPSFVLKTIDPHEYRRQYEEFVRSSSIL